MFKGPESNPQHIIMAVNFSHFIPAYRRIKTEFEELIKCRFCGRINFLSREIFICNKITSYG